MTTIQQLIDILLAVEDKSKTVGIYCKGFENHYYEIGEVTEDCEGVYLEPEWKG